MLVKSSYTSVERIQPANQPQSGDNIVVVNASDSTLPARVGGLMRTYRNLKKGPIKYGALFSLVEEWGKTNPMAAIRFALNKVTPFDRDTLIDTAYSSKSSEELKRLLASTKNAETHDALVVASLDRFAEDGDYKSAQTLAASLGNDPKAAMVYQALIAKMNGKDLQQLATDTASLDPGVKTAIASSLGVRLSQENPEWEAAQFNSLFTNPEDRAAAMPSLVRGLAKANPTDAAAWINTNITDSNQRDIAAGNMACAMANDNSDAAIDWLTSIQDQNLFNTYYGMFMTALQSNASHSPAVARAAALRQARVSLK
jgi:hypothetical protein